MGKLVPSNMGPLQPIQLSKWGIDFMGPLMHLGKYKYIAAAATNYVTK